MENKFRLNYTLLSLWEQGKVDEAVKCFLKISRDKTDAMEIGLAIDRVITNEIENNKKLPDFFGGIELKDPIPQFHLVVDHNELFEVSGILDCYDDGILYEFKTGITPSNVYISGKQIWIYAYLLKKAGYPLDRIYVFRYDLLSNKADYSMAWYDDYLIENAKDYIDGLGYEIYNYFKSSGLF